MTEIPFGISRQRDNNAYDARKALIYKYEVLYEKQEILNEVTNRWNKCKIKDASIDPDIYFNELYNLNLKFNNIKAKYGKYEDELKSHVFDVLAE